MAKKKTEETKGKGTGYRAKTKISMRPSEEWSAEPQTELRVQELARMITEGGSRSEIQKYAEEKYEVQPRQARAYYAAACRYLVPDDEEKFRKEMVHKNISRLENIAEKCLKDRNYQCAVAAIKELNNVLNPNKNSVTIAKNNLGEEMIQISFD